MAHQSSVMRAGVTRMLDPNYPEPEIKEPLDTLPHDSQPPGVDEDEPQSLEEALTG
mgnify:CR=1 FL=1